MDIDEVVRALLADPVGIDVARRTLPDRNGVYAWWTDMQAIPGVPPQPHPREETRELFYVGIAPRDARSSLQPSRSASSTITSMGTQAHPPSVSCSPPSS